MNSPANPQPNRAQQHLLPGAQSAKSTPHAEMVRLRTQVYGSCPHFSDPAIARFVASCFESDATVHAYFKPMPLPVLARGRILTGRTVKAVPLTQALRAADAARSMGLIEADSEHHKKLVFLAALLTPVALFLNANSNTRYFAGPSQQAMHQHLRALAARVLLKPLQELSKRDKESALLLANLLGFRTSMQVDGELASRMAATVCLATLPIKVIWRANY